MLLDKQTAIRYTTTLALTVMLLFIAFGRSPKEISVANSFSAKEYMQGVAVTEYKIDGQLQNQLLAQHWHYIPSAGHSLFKSPHLTVYKPDGSAWHIRSEHGRAYHKTLGSTIDDITLWQSVSIERPASANIVPVLLETSELCYKPKNAFLSSDQKVTLNKPGLVITGVGLRAFLNKSLIELLSDVKTHYVSHLS